ncbi:hypothetical protein BGZ60DRAFT_523038 [Tricladium varicosporioides]|nr:hypothetical protein BGZ60DRAFT_523038 [Hymenoscyphus varicosporioides]
MSDGKPKSDPSKTAEEKHDGAGNPGENNSPKAEPRRRASRAGTRSVATLSEAQLARKRANDREAQRSIRQRTKDRIERLEQRIKELIEEQNDDRSFEEVQRRNEELEEELRVLKENMPQQDDNMMLPNFSPSASNFLGISMPPRSLGFQAPWGPNMSPGVTGASSSFPTTGYTSVFSSRDSNHSASNAGSPLSEMGSANDYFGSVDIAPPTVVNPPVPQGPSMLGGRPGIVRSTSHPETRTQQAWSPSPFGFMGINENMATSNSSNSRQNARTRRMSSIPSLRPKTSSVTSMPSPFLNQPPFSEGGSCDTPIRSGPQSIPRGVPQAVSSVVQLPLSNDISMGIQTPLGSGVSPDMGQQSGISIPTSNNTSPVGLGVPQQPAMQYMPTMAPAPLATSMPTMSSFLNQPSRHSWELPLRFLPPTGPVDAILIGILQRQRSLALSGTTGETLTGPTQPSLQALIHPERSNEIHPIASVISGLLQRTALRGLAEKVGALFVIYRLTQWQISPNLTTFNNLPEWHQPRSSQYVTPHPIWATQIIWGKLRDAVINNQEIYATDEFQHTYTANLNVNWPYRDADVLNFEGKEVTITTNFEHHIKNLASWSLDEPFGRRYPELKDCFKSTGEIDGIDHL